MNNHVEANKSIKEIKRNIIILMNLILMNVILMNMGKTLEMKKHIVKVMKMLMKLSLPT